MAEWDYRSMEAELYHNKVMREELDAISTQSQDESVVDPNIIGRIKYIMEDIAHGNWAPWNYRSEASSILEAIGPEEEKPLDGDLIEAYGIYADIIWTWTNREAMCKQIDQAILKAIKRGRQLEKDGSACV